MMCEFCGETFKSQDEENEHVKNLHPKVKNLTCDLCEFETEEEVNEHMKTIHW